jgi:hypothetical protein
LILKTWFLFNNAQESQSSVADSRSVGPHEDIGGPRQRRRPHRYSLKERLSISGADSGGDQSEVLGTEEINLVGHDDVGGAKTKR